MREQGSRQGLRAGVLVVISTLIVAGCTARGGYEGVRTSVRNECARRPPSQYEACMADAKLSWEDYERERAELREDAAGADPPPP